MNGRVDLNRCRCAARHRQGARPLLPADARGPLRPPGRQLSPPGSRPAAFLHPHLTGQSSDVCPRLLFSSGQKVSDVSLSLPPPPSAWLRRRDAVPDHRLQLRPQRGRKAAHLQGADPAQPRGAPLSRALGLLLLLLSRCCSRGPPTAFSSCFSRCLKAPPRVHLGDLWTIRSFPPPQMELAAGASVVPSPSWANQSCGRSRNS